MSDAPVSSSPVQALLSALQTAFEQTSFQKCTLSKPGHAAPSGLKNIYIRPVSIKNKIKLAFTYRYQTRDEVKNYDLGEALQLLETLIGPTFLDVALFTTERDAVLQTNKKGQPVLTFKAAAQSEAADLRHNREKNRLLEPSAPWLRRLGIAGAQGEILPAAQDKWRQINKFLEIIDSLLRAHPLPPDACIADMGSGKGYLTFALYDFLTRHKNLQPRITGIELRVSLVDLCNDIAREAGFSNLQFIASDIAVYQPERLDLLIALHACDTATDLALATGMRQKAGIIVVAPCCHKQIRKEMKANNEMKPLLQHGILEERQAEIITDGIRALLLEADGYKTQVFEFISTEHTAKNVMITAIGGAKRREEALKQIEALKAGFGIREHYLETLLKKNSNA